MGHPALDLTSKTAVVIGGTSGIGRALALGLAQAGADVVATGRREELVRSVATEIQSLGRKSLAVASDVGSRSSLEALHEAVSGEFGHVDILVNSAGTTRKTPTLEVSDEEQERRFEARIEDPLRQWKLSPMDLPSRERWYEYSRARDQMLDATDTDFAPWYIARSDDKKRARLNCIAHLLSLIPYEKLKRDKVKLPKRSTKRAYDDQAALEGRKFVPEKY